MSLSQQELCAISERISVDYAPRFSRHGHAAVQGMPFSSQELLTISRQISLDFAPSRWLDQSQLVLMAVSPSMLHVYWQVAKQSLSQQMKQAGSSDSATFKLRIYQDPQAFPSAVTMVEEPLEKAGRSSEEAKSSAEKVNSFLSAAEPWLELSLNSWQGQQDILLPQGIGSVSNRFNAVLGQSGFANAFNPLVYSNMTTLPTSSRSLQDNALNPAIDPFMKSHFAPSSFSTHKVSGQGKPIL